MKSLFLAVVVQALVDDDLDFVISPTFVDYLLYIGLSPAAIRRVRMAYLRDEIDPTRLAFQALNAPRSMEDGPYGEYSASFRGGVGE